MEISRNIENLSVSQLELVIEKYPWFSLARAMFLGRIAAADINEAENELKKCSSFIQDRKLLHKEFSESITRTISSKDMEPDIRYIASTSEYFSSSEIAGAADTLNEGLLCGNRIESEEKQLNKEYVTETLARIYQEQEYYDQALEVYSKLILLYPKKSAYFADCVEKLQQKRNNTNGQQTK